jgi:class 3 adenylate cyclase
MGVSDDDGGSRPRTATVTLLFCDLVGSTELMTRVGDDVADGIRRDLFEALSNVVTEHRGTVVKTMGDGMMVSFQRSAADAVACAMSMQKAIADLATAGERQDLHIRIGVSTGEAAYEGDDWFGTPVVEAQRLEGAAQPDQILVSEVVRSVVGNRRGVRFHDAGSRELKGFARSMPVVEVLWREGAPHSAPQPSPAKRQHARRWIAGAAIAGAALLIGIGAWWLTSSSEGREPSAKAAPIAATGGYTPRLEDRVCPPELAADSTVRCHDLVVPEDRSDPAGRQMRILVSVAPSHASDPGVPTLSLAGPLDGILATTVRSYGDSITLDIRGLQASDNLTCPEIAGVMRELFALPMYSEEATALYLDASARCGERYASEGRNLDVYGSDDIALDVRDLAIAMGWTEFNLMAAFDWTAAALEFVELYGDHLRAVVLAEPILPRHAVFDDAAARADAAFDAYYAACDRDEECAIAFPELETELAQALSQFEDEPTVATAPDPEGGPPLTVLLDGDRLVYASVTALGEQDALPVLASLLSADRDEGLTATADFIVNRTPLQADAPHAWFISHNCRDQAAYHSVSTVNAARVTYPEFAVYTRDPLLAACDRWPTTPRPGRPSAEAPPASRAPALIYRGELNPYHSAEYLQESARWFARPIVVTFPALTTGALTTGPACIVELRLAFLRDPTAELDVDTCVASIPPVRFEGS